MPPLPNFSSLGTFRLKNNPTGDIYSVQGNKLLNANLETLGQSQFNPANAPADAIARAAGPSGQFVGGPVSYMHLDPSQRQDLGMQALQKQGVDYNSIPVQDYNLADINNYFDRQGGGRGQLTDFSSLGGNKGLPPAPTGNLMASGGLGPQSQRTPITLGNGQQVFADTQGNFFDASGQPVSHQQVAGSTAGAQPQLPSSPSPSTYAPSVTPTSPTIPQNTGSPTAPQPTGSTPAAPATGTAPVADTTSTSNTALQDLLKAMTPSPRLSDLYNQNLQIEAERRQYHEAQILRRTGGEESIAQPFLAGQERDYNAALDLKQAPIQASMQAEQYQQGLGIQKAQAASDYYNKTFEIPAWGSLAQRQPDGSIKIIAQGQQRLPSSLQGYQYAQKQGYPGTFEQWQAESANNQVRYGINPNTGEPFQQTGPGPAGTPGYGNPATPPIPSPSIPSPSTTPNPTPSPSQNTGQSAFGAYTPGQLTQYLQQNMPGQATDTASLGKLAQSLGIQGYQNNPQFNSQILQKLQGGMEQSNFGTNNTVQNTSKTGLDNIGFNGSNPTDAAALTMFQSGDTKPTRFPAQNNSLQVRARQIAEALGLGKNYNLTSGKAVQDAIKTQWVYYGNISSAIDTVDLNAGILSKLMSKVNPTSSPFINDLTSAFNNHVITSGERTQFNTALQTVRSEYARIVARGKAPDDGDKATSNKLLPDNISGVDLQKVLTILKQEGTNVKAGTQNSIDFLKGMGVSGEQGSTLGTGGQSENHLGI